MDKPDRVYSALEEWAMTKASAFQADPTPEALDEWANAQEILKIADELLYGTEDEASLAFPENNLRQMAHQIVSQL